MAIRQVVKMLFFFFKQKTAYEMRISDWNSDVCSSDLAVEALHLPLRHGLFGFEGAEEGFLLPRPLVGLLEVAGYLGGREEEAPELLEIGRASCRERVCQYV